MTIACLANAFLADAARVSPAAHHNYVLFLSRLSDEVGERPAEAVAPHEVEAVSRRPQWSPTHRANFLGMVQMAYRWAGRARLVANSMGGLRKPPRASRGVSAVISPNEFNRFLSHAREGTRDLLTLLWATGARPAEVAGLTAERVRASADGVIPLASHKTSHKGKARFLVLTGEAWGVARRRAETVGSGLIFPSEVGRRLTAQAIAHRLKKLCRRAGIRHLIPTASATPSPPTRSPAASQTQRWRPCWAIRRRPCSTATTRT